MLNSLHLSYSYGTPTCLYQLDFLPEYWPVIFVQISSDVFNCCNCKILNVIKSKELRKKQKPFKVQKPQSLRIITFMFQTCKGQVV